MRYLYHTDRPEEPMHISMYTPLGVQTWTPLCRAELDFNRSINAPWCLGRKVCSECQRIADAELYH